MPLLTGTSSTPTLGVDGWLPPLPVGSDELDLIWTHGSRAELLTDAGVLVEATWQKRTGAVCTVAGWWTDDGNVVGVSQVRAWRPARQ